jgi:PST family polysaccharide transporter
MGGQAANFVLKLGSTAVLARLLTPADFGLIAMVTAVTGFVEMFKEAGLSMATIQRAEINHRQISTLFWINLGLSILLMFVVVGLAPAVAWFYGEPQLLWITIALGAMFPLGGLTIQHVALLRRQMRFGTLVSIDVTSNAVGIAAAITAAAFGARYWALVIMMAASGAANAALVWITCPWVPGLPKRGAGVRPMLAFGGNLTGFAFINYWARSADNVLIGWYC